MRQQSYCRQWCGFRVGNRHFAKITTLAKLFKHFFTTTARFGDVAKRLRDLHQNLRNEYGVIRSIFQLLVFDVSLDLAVRDLHPALHDAPTDLSL